MRLLLLYTPLPLLALLLALTARNRAYKVCPMFFSYVAFGVVADMARFAAHNHRHAYYWTFWTTETGYCILGVAAMCEVFYAVPCVRSRWTHFVFPGIVALALSLSWAHTQSVPSQFRGFPLYILAGDITVRFVQVIAFFVIGFLAALFGIRWYHLGVAAGFGFYAAIELLNVIGVLDHGIKYVPWWNAVTVAAYSLAVLIWIWFFRVPPEEEPSPDIKLIARYISVLGQYLSSMRFASMRSRM